MTGMISADLFKLRRRRMTWILLALLPLVVAIVYTLFFVSLGAKGSAAEDGQRNLEASLAFNNVVSFGDATVFRIVAIVAVIFAGATTAAEFGWRTIVTLAAWSGDRRRLVLARLAALGVFVGLALCVGYVSLFAACAVGNAARGTFEPGDVHAGLFLDGALAASRAWLLVMVYAVLAVTVATLTRSSAAAVAIPLVVLLIEPFGVAALDALGGPASMATEFTLSRNVDGVLASDGAVAGTGESLAGYPPALRAASFLLLFVVLTGWAGIAAFSRRDLSQ